MITVDDKLKIHGGKFNGFTVSDFRIDEDGVLLVSIQTEGIKNSKYGTVHVAKFSAAFILEYLIDKMDDSPRAK